jgi:C4-dicarboxylate-specific signal transduction histidine kinase
LPPLPSRAQPLAQSGPSPCARLYAGTSQSLEDVADQVQLQQVLLNLFNNALDATSAAAGRVGVLTVKLQVLESSDVLILVEDIPAA